MLFPTTTFAIFFLVVFTFNWLLINRRAVWKPFMLAASYLFYGYWDWRFVTLIVASTLVNHAMAVAMAQTERKGIRRIFLIGSLIFNLGSLGFFKYYSFFVLSVYSVCNRIGLPCSLPLLDIVLPVGISFFTFQAMSYVIDVYRKEIPPARELIDFAVYLAFFPQLVAGPIVRAKTLLPQITAPVDRKHIDGARACTLILAGLFKKVVIATYVAQTIVDPVFSRPSLYGALDIIVALYAYAVQIYCDFSAYSDIAIGVGNLLGFELPVNFNAPYFSVSLGEFWRRWHISLSTWLRDYLFIPLGGLRRSSRRVYTSLFITFLLGGLWHGAKWHFVIWGALNGIYLALERMVRSMIRKKRPRHSRREMSPTMRLIAGIWTFHVVCLLIVFFRAETMEHAILLFSGLGRWTAPTLVSGVLWLAIVAGFATQFLDGDRIHGAWERFARLHPVLQGAAAAIVLTVILSFGPKGVAPFIYFQF